MDIYDANTYNFQRCQDVPDTHRNVDMTMYGHYCKYICSTGGVYRLHLHGDATQHRVDDKIHKFSVNATHNVLAYNMS